MAASLRGGQATSDVRRYRLICDGSAAAALDKNTFVVANDEHDALLFYRHGKKDL